MLTLEVLICTIDDGIGNIVEHLLPPIPGISYLISWQQSFPQQLENYAALRREDIRIVTLEGRGLSKNRNHALAHAQGDLLLLADDDAEYKPEYFETIRESFETYSDAQILTFQVATSNGKLLKSYAADSFLYQDRPKGTYVSSLEIVLRREAPRPNFNVHFGLGSPYLSCGEEEIFIHEAYRKGAVIRYIPQVIVQTNEQTTGKRFLTDVRVRRSKGAVLYYFHGYLGAILRCAKYACTLPCHKFLFFKDMYDGIRYARKNI